MTRPCLAVDSSAIIAILNDEPEKAAFRIALDKADRMIGWPTILEIRIWVIRRNFQDLAIWFDTFLIAPTTKVVGFGLREERFASSAFTRFGKGRHPAKLNYGDCMTYAVARLNGLPLLFKGADFGQTDLLVHEASVAVG